MIRRFGARLGLTFLSFVVFLLVEACAFGLYERTYIAGPWEFRAVLLYALPIAVALAAPVALLGTVLSLKSARPYGMATAISLLVAACIHASAGGRRVVAYRLGLTILSFVVSFLTLTVAQRRLQGRFTTRAQGALGVTLVLSSWLLDRYLLPRLYEGLHALWLLGCAIGVVLLSGALFRHLAGEGTEDADDTDSSGDGAAKVEARIAGLSLLVFLSCLVWVQRGARELLRFDNVRLLLADHAPVLGRGVRLAARLGNVAPPSVQGGPDETFPATAKPRPGAPKLDWSGRDIVLVTIDALRADHVGSYGYGRKTTPRLDALAKESARFTHAYCPTPHTSYSVTSLMTGKYMRPLLALGLGDDSDTFASYLRKYDYRTAAFYPPAVFFIDEERFQGIRDRHLDFEYAKVEFTKPDLRMAQINEYLASASKEKPLFLWLHLFEPHEPYEKHAGYDFGESDIDRYDSEIAATDDFAGKVIDRLRELKKDPVIIVTADHGEEFGDHGGRYHGTTVYEEQVRVPLLVHGAGVPAGDVSIPVQTIDLLPTVLGALGVPVPPRLRGRDLGAVLAGQGREGREAGGAGFAFAEAEHYTMVAEGSNRLVCERQLGACTLYDIVKDPRETKQAGEATDPAAASTIASLKALQVKTERAHGLFEGDRGARMPEALRRALAGDREAALDVAALLDDARPDIRLAAADVLFHLRAPAAVTYLERARKTEERPENLEAITLALARTKEATLPEVGPILSSTNELHRQRAGWLLAELEDPRGEDMAIALFKNRRTLDLEEQRELVGALARIKSQKAVPLFVEALDDVRLRPYLAIALGELGDPRAKAPLLELFAKEPYIGTRLFEATALERLATPKELEPGLVHWLGDRELFPGIGRFVLSGRGKSGREGLFSGVPKDASRADIPLPLRVLVAIERAEGKPLADGEPALRLTGFEGLSSRPIAISASNQEDLDRAELASETKEERAKRAGRRGASDAGAGGEAGIELHAVDVLAWPTAARGKPLEVVVLPSSYGKIVGVRAIPLRVGP